MIVTGTPVYAIGTVLRMYFISKVGYEPKLTESTLDFARHYGCSVLPARASLAMTVLVLLHSLLPLVLFFAPLIVHSSIRV